MHKTHVRIAAAISLLAAGALSAIALRPLTTSHTATLAASPAVQVRTQVIRQTVHIVRHERPPQPVRSRPGAAGSSPPAGSSAVASPATARVRTATSGAAAGVSPAAAESPVRTRTSGAASSNSGSSAAGPVRTRTSGASGGDGRDGGSSGHDD